MNKLIEKRPWGEFLQFTLNEVSTVKILKVKSGEELSLQYHNDRSEFWRVLKGNPTVLIGESTVRGIEGDEFFIEPKTNHQIIAKENDVEILEIATGNFDENDIIRISDKYER